MNEFYYTENPTSESNERSFTMEFLGETCRFTYDNGVFSKGELDEGTAYLLSALPPLGGRILDLGCGWGPVGVILGRKYPEAEIVMSDVNERALTLSRKNLAANGVKNASCLSSDGFEHIEGTFDAIVTNPPIRAGKEKIYAMFDTAMERLNEGGALYLVIRKQQGAESAVKYLSHYGVEILLKKKGFFVLKVGGNANEDR